ncbi:mannose-6-phosphate isomerase [Escherichia coli]|uniref:mannose-6-phosphate isomerase, class I n=1 Tax=Escherichia coli TaxID=562 RepID=UPI0010D29396|nr:mannose-6-phosphate isomerase, class I [Escherichia coli]GDW11061.1 mannose-6-phosphate isomerase [Escherichia coli]
MQKLINSVQNYAWGSKTALTELYGMENPSSQPMAELWMGAHPKSSSRVQNAAGDIVSLRDVIESDKSTLLGEAVAKRFGELPFLFKVLCAAQPLSIQVHPNKHNSEIGFAKENAAGIPMDAAERNYKDPNHKPELVFALTPFLAMNAFREFSEIVSLLQPVKQGAELDFSIPVDDFAFSLHDLSDKETTISQQSAAILFCVEGDATLCQGSQQLQLKPGESAFIAANESPVTVKGHGRLARVYNKL